MCVYERGSKSGERAASPLLVHGLAWYSMMAGTRGREGLVALRCSYCHLPPQQDSIVRFFISSNASDLTLGKGLVVVAVGGSPPCRMLVVWKIKCSRFGRDGWLKSFQIQFSIKKLLENGIL